MFRKLLDYAEAGDNIGALLLVALLVKTYNVVSIATGSITPHTEFKVSSTIIKD